jgi:hypothetical protein
MRMTQIAVRRSIRTGVAPSSRSRQNLTYRHSAGWLAARIAAIAPRSCATMKAAGLAKEIDAVDQWTAACGARLRSRPPPRWRERAPTPLNSFSLFVPVI